MNVTKQSAPEKPLLELVNPLPHEKEERTLIAQIRARGTLGGLRVA